MGCYIYISVDRFPNILSGRRKEKNPLDAFISRGGITVKNVRSFQNFTHWFFGPFGEENSKRLGV